MLDEMFGLSLEARAEGIAAIDGDGSLSDVRFPSTGTVGHCALLMIEKIGPTAAMADAERIVVALALAHSAHWAKDRTATPERLTRDALALLVSQRLVEIDGDEVRVLAAARRYAPTVTISDATQGALW